MLTPGRRQPPQLNSILPLLGHWQYLRGSVPVMSLVIFTVQFYINIMRTTLLTLLSLATVLHGAYAFMCYTQTTNSDSRGVTFCAKGSCYSIGAGAFGAQATEKGCYESAKPDGCVSLDVLIASQHTCFCNSFLCNASSMPSSPFLLLLLLPCLLVNLL
ncbi:hypothetical protein Pmani_027342 [Petrolisthes manimaculis]|uniref:UPAR/Ly6 domain-containing protein n=1 Tax=Petrolisthes manimaculis TaxID=1843537 RepID=A0AAE1P4D0_9EUCA|nr:hypothetical protein Pmani_027342 [Petrolisthes manimaculis]